MSEQRGESNFALDSVAFLARDIAGPAQSNYSNGDVIFVQGGPADAVFNIEHGRIKCSVVSSDGKERVISILEEHEFFGEECVIGQANRLVTATALTKCSVTRIETSVMTRALREDPKFAALFISYLIERGSRYQADLVNHLFNKSEKRLARTLLLLANAHEDDSDELVVSSISQDMLAEMVGTTRSRINHFMNKFRQLGFVEYSNSRDRNIRLHRSLLDSVMYETPEWV